jgi:hypothetical protein
MAVDDFNPLPDDNISKDGKEREDSRQSRLSVDDEERYVINLYAVGQVTNASPAGVCVCDYDDLMPTINKLLRPSQSRLSLEFAAPSYRRNLIYMALNAS